MKQNDTYITDDTLTALFFRTARRMNRKGGADYAQQRVLRILLSGEEVNQKDLLERLKIQPGSLSELIAKLEDKGYILKKRSEEDQRRMVLQITEEGRAWINRFVETKDEIMFAALNETERAQMRKLLEKMEREEV